MNNEICLAIWERPCLDEHTLESFPAPKSESVCGLGSDCRVSDLAIFTYFADVTDEAEKIG